MRITLDEHPCDVHADSVEQAIAAAAALAETNGRMIVEVIVDGKALTQLAGEELANTAREIHLTSADPVELVCQTFTDAGEALRDADRLQQSAAELIQSDRIPAAMEKLGEAFAIWSSVQQAVTMGAEVIGFDLEAELPGLQTTSLNDAVEQLNTQLRVIEQALKTNDPVGLSDTLLYDLPQTVVVWRGLMESLRSRAANTQPPKRP
jgi:hypothetical protein